MCDEYLGKVLDKMDELNLWEDTMLIVNTDHGFMLGEHDWWGKMVMPLYNHIVHIPLFIWDPRSAKKAEYRDTLVQTIDLAPTLLDYFAVEIPKDMTGKPLKDVVKSDKSIREDSQPLYNYTLMPTHRRGFFEGQELNNIQLSHPFSFTKGYKVMKTPARKHRNFKQYGNLLFNVKEDPKQENLMQDEKVEQKLINHIIDLMKIHDAPEEQYERVGIKQ